MGRDEMDELFSYEGDGVADEFSWETVSEPTRIEVKTGTYNAIVENAEMSFNDAGLPQVSVTYKITDGEFADKRVYGAGGNLYYTEKALPYTKDRLAILLGEKPSGKYPSLSALAASNAEEILGRLVRVRVGPDTYKEVTSQRVKGILPPMPGGEAPASGKGRQTPPSPF